MRQVRIVEVPIFVEGRRGATKLRLAEVATDCRKTLISAEDGRRMGVSVSVRFPSEQTSASQGTGAGAECSKGSGTLRDVASSGGEECGTASPV